MACRRATLRQLASMEMLSAGGVDLSSQIASLVYGKLLVAAGAKAVGSKVL